MGRFDYIILKLMSPSLMHRLHQTISLSCLCPLPRMGEGVGAFAFVAPKDFFFIIICITIVWLSNHLTFIVPDELYSRNASCLLNIYVFIALSMKCLILTNDCQVLMVVVANKTSVLLIPMGTSCVPSIVDLKTRFPSNY